MSLALMRAALTSSGFKRSAFFAGAVMVGVLGQTPQSSAQPAGDKEQIGLLYVVQLAPKVCKWADAGDASKLDAQVAEAEKALGITPDERTKFMAMAEEELRKPGNCDAGGMVRAMYDEAIK